MPKFTTFEDIEKYLKTQISSSIGTSSGSRIEDYLKDEMYNAVWRYVYSVYKPEGYERREDFGGLSDQDNMIMALPYVNSKGQIQIDFYNLTTGSDLGNEQVYTSDLIEFGQDDDISWSNPNGEWAKPRPFKEKMTEKIKSNPNELIEVVKSALKDSGFVVR